MSNCPSCSTLCIGQFLACISRINGSRDMSEKDLNQYQRVIFVFNREGMEFSSQCGVHVYEYFDTLNNPSSCVHCVNTWQQYSSV